MLSPGIRVAKDNAQNLTEQRDALPAGIRLTEAEIAKTKESLGSRLSMLDHWRKQRRECLEQIDAMPSPLLHPYFFLSSRRTWSVATKVLGGGLDRFLSVLLNGIGKLLGF